MLKIFTGSCISTRSMAPAWKRWMLIQRQRAIAFSRSFMPGRTAESMMSLALRKLFRPFESQG
jgi:hypothetical protein